jgi:hypothetical protein
MVGMLHAHGIKAIGATLTSTVHQTGTTQATHDAHQAINDFILNSGIFDSTADFYGATVDLADPERALRPEFATHSDPPTPFDFLHLGRAGSQAEANTLDIYFFAPSESAKQ